MDNIQQNPSICALAWNGMAVDTNGNLFPCCQALYAESSPGNINNENILEAINNHNFKKIRHTMLKGEKLSMCQSCYKLEDNQQESERLRMNRYYHENWQKNLEQTDNNGTIDQPQITHWSIRASNICNLKCRTCNPTSSTSWFNDSLLLSYDKLTPEKKLLTPLKGKLEQIIDSLKTSKTLYFAGGEPLLHPEFYEICDYIIENNTTVSSIGLNTNLTSLSLSHFSALKIFQKLCSKKIKLNLNVSIDAPYEFAQYIRSGTDWSTLIKNLKIIRVFCPDVAIFINCTVSVLNLHIMPELLEALYLHLDFELSPLHFEISYVHDPNYYNVGILNQDEILLVKEKYISYQEKWKSPELTNILNKIIHYTEYEIENCNLNKDALRTQLREVTQELDSLRSEKSNAIFLFTHTENLYQKNICTQSRA